MIEVPQLRSELTRLIGAEFASEDRHAHMFSPQALFVVRSDLDQLASAFRALHAMTHNAAYVQRVLQWAGPISREAHAIHEGVILTTST